MTDVKRFKETHTIITRIDKEVKDLSAKVLKIDSGFCYMTAQQLEAKRFVLARIPFGDTHQIQKYLVSPTFT
jgi:hypothetical protein